MERVRPKEQWGEPWVGRERSWLPIYRGYTDVQSITYSACKKAVLTTFAAPRAGPNVIVKSPDYSPRAYGASPADLQTC